MRVSIHSRVERFLAHAEPLLRSDPFSTNVVAVVAAGIAAGSLPDSDRNLWAVVEDCVGVVIGVAMHTPPHRLFVSRMPAEAAASLAQAMVEGGRDLPGVSGAVGSTKAFAEVWEARTGGASRVVTAMRMYRLGQIAPQEGVAGEAGTARPDDRDVVAEWFAAFHDEAQPHAPIEDWTVVARRRIAVHEVHLWRIGDDPVAVAAVSHPAAGVARVGPVYTPPPWRRRGYGAAITAGATAAAQAAGAEHVVLYTDLANATSNSIYQAIGYRADHDAEERAFLDG
jgi:predicted GNAT family acetyltransferase